MRTRGDDHDHDYFGYPPAHGAGPESGELESELARRLRNLAWPAPPPGLKERCLREILTRMAEEQEKKIEPLEATRLHSWRGTGQRYALTRRVAHAYRPPLPTPPRPVRCAAAL